MTFCCTHGGAFAGSAFNDFYERERERDEAHIHLGMVAKSHADFRARLSMKRGGGYIAYTILYD